MVVLNAMLHNPKYTETVEKILNKYSGQIKNGLIPNMLAESGREANYDSVDATLWFIILLWKLGKRKQSKDYWKDVIAISEDILISIINNFTYPFDVRREGLIELQRNLLTAPGGCAHRRKTDYSPQRCTNRDKRPLV
jgi:glycogen debranching enzyme